MAIFISDNKLCVWNPSPVMAGSLFTSLSVPGAFLSNLHKYLEKCFNSSNPIQAERAKILDSNIKNAQLFTAGLHLIDKGFVVKYSQPNYIELSINGKHEDELFEIQKSLLQSLEVISKFEIRANGDIVWILRPNPKP